ncbi:MAG: hypothetical protein AAFU67_09315, partial [Bacteroidota bacterium]
FLTGYVPGDVNFFDFGGWASYDKNNMKVTDCGCFGDFLKLEPKTSFFKDVFLLIPSVLFLFFHKKMHEVFTPAIRSLIVVVTVVGVTLYCFSNYRWDIPGQDFRPFKVGVDIAEQKQREEAAAANVQVLGYTITPKDGGEVINFTMQEFLANYQNYPEDKFDIQQEVSEPEVAPTKISDFEVSDYEGYDVAPDLLAEPGYTFVIVSYQLKGEQTGTKIREVEELVMQIDTILEEERDMIAEIDTTMVPRVKEIEVPQYNFDPAYLKKWSDKVQPVMLAAQEKGYKVVALTKYESPSFINAFRQEIGAEYDFLQGDDIMLKTIIRSNPGVMLLKGGKILEKWHYRKLPDYERISTEFGLE